MGGATSLGLHSMAVANSATVLSGTSLTLPSGGLAGELQLSQWPQAGLDGAPGTLGSVLPPSLARPRPLEALDTVPVRPLLHYHAPGHDACHMGLPWSACVAEASPLSHWATSQHQVVQALMPVAPAHADPCIHVQASSLDKLRREVSRLNGEVERLEKEVLRQKGLRCVFPLLSMPGRPTVVCSSWNSYT